MRTGGCFFLLLIMSQSSFGPLDANWLLCSHLTFWSYGGISCVFTMIIRQEYWLCGYWIEHVISYRLRCLDFRVFRRAVGVRVESGLLKLVIMKTSGFTTTATEVHSTVITFACRHRECHNSGIISPLTYMYRFCLLGCGL